jgi:hypothetical protein
VAFAVLDQRHVFAAARSRTGRPTVSN